MEPGVMEDVTNILTSVELWVALLGGGGLIKLIEWLIKRFFLRAENRIALQNSEKDSLRDDIDYLRREVAELRKEIASLKENLDKREQQVNLWQKRYWEVSAALDRLIIFLRYNASEESREQAMPILRALDESGLLEADENRG